MIEIRQISSIETYPVRHSVLRQGKPLESCRFEGDDDESTVHLGLFYNGRISGALSIFDRKNPEFPVKHQRQLRGMAVLDDFQGKGFGRMLITEAEKIGRHRKVGLYWFNARIKAVPFYEKLGYGITGDAFDIPGIGDHYVMYKEFVP